jgi:hypothetical protein
VPDELAALVDGLLPAVDSSPTGLVLQSVRPLLLSNPPFGGEPFVGVAALVETLTRHPRPLGRVRDAPASRKCLQEGGASLHRDSRFRLPPLLRPRCRHRQAASAAASLASRLAGFNMFTGPRRGFSMGSSGTGMPKLAVPLHHQFGRAARAQRPLLTLCPGAEGQPEIDLIEVETETGSRS